MKKAKELLQKSARSIIRKAEQLGGREAEALSSFGASVSNDADVIADEKDWNKNRKEFKAKQYKLDKQQSDQSLFRLMRVIRK